MQVVTRYPHSFGVGSQLHYNFLLFLFFFLPQKTISVILKTDEFKVTRMFCRFLWYVCRVLPKQCLITMCERNALVRVSQIDESSLPEAHHF